MGSVSQTMIGPVSSTRVESCAQRVLRTPSPISRASDDFVLVAVGTSGVNGVFQDGREAVMSSGQFVIYDTTRPYGIALQRQLHANGFPDTAETSAPACRLVRYVDRDHFFRRRPLERLAYEFLLGMGKTIDEIDSATATRLAGSGARSRGDGLRRQDAATFIDLSFHRSALLYRLKNYILDPSARPRTVSAARRRRHGISPRYASDLMASEQTSFRSYVQMQRLERCKLRSVGPRSHGPAHQRHRLWLGFLNDLAHFSRIFKQKFGASPREWREHPTHLRRNP